MIGCATQRVQFQPAEPKFYQNYRLLKPGMSINEVNGLLGDIEQYALLHTREVATNGIGRYFTTTSRNKSNYTFDGKNFKITNFNYNWVEMTNIPGRGNNFHLSLEFIDNKLQAVRISGTHMNGLHNPPTYESEASRGNDLKVIFDKSTNYITSKDKKKSLTPTSSNRSYDEAKKELLQRYMKKEITKEEYFQIFKELKASYGK